LRLHDTDSVPWLAKILIIDNEPTPLQSVRAYLEQKQEGYQVRTALNGRAAGAGSVSLSHPPGW